MELLSTRIKTSSMVVREHSNTTILDNRKGGHSRVELNHSQLRREGKGESKNITKCVYLIAMSVFLIEITFSSSYHVIVTE